MRHEIRVVKDHFYPFKPYWICMCGHKMKATVMGPELYREFKAHKEEMETWTSSSTE